MNKYKLIAWGFVVFFLLPGRVVSAPILTDWTTADTEAATGELGGVSVNFSSAANSIYPEVVEQGPFFSDSAAFNPPVASSGGIVFWSAQSSVGDSFLIEFGDVIENPLIYLSNVDSILTFDPSVLFTRLSGNDLFSVIGNTVSGLKNEDGDYVASTGEGLLQLNGSYSSIAFSSANGLVNEDFVLMQIAVDSVPGAISEPSGLFLLGFGVIGLFSLARKQSS